MQLLLRFAAHAAAADDWQKPSRTNKRRQKRKWRKKPLTANAIVANLRHTTEDTGYEVTTVKRGFFVARNPGASRQFSRIGALMTRRTKAGNGANKAGGVSSVVESMRHLQTVAHYPFINYGVMQS